MALLVCAATPKELAALLPGVFPDPANIPEMQPMVGQLKQADAIFLATGVGPLNASLALGYAFGLTHPTSGSNMSIDAVLYAGLAGAFDLSKTPLCSIWRVETEIWPEYGLNDGTTVTASAFSYPQWISPQGQRIYERIDLADYNALPGIRWKCEPWPSCKSLTVAGVTASFDRRDALWSAWHVELENMEGFAAAYAAQRDEIPLVEIRVVSNKVGPRAKDEKDFEGALNSLSRILPSMNLI